MRLAFNIWVQGLSFFALLATQALGVRFVRLWKYVTRSKALRIRGQVLLQVALSKKWMGKLNGLTQSVVLALSCQMDPRAKFLSILAFSAAMGLISSIQGNGFVCRLPIQIKVRKHGLLWSWMRSFRGFLRSSFSLPMFPPSLLCSVVETIRIRGKGLPG